MQLLGALTRQPGAAYLRNMESSGSLRLVILLLPSLVFIPTGCIGAGTGDDSALDQFPLHLEEHLESAAVEAADPPDDPPAAVEWSFDVAQSDWKVVVPDNSDQQSVSLHRLDDALRINLPPESRTRQPMGREVLEGSIYVDLPDWRREDWAYVAVRARASATVEELALMFNLGGDKTPFELGGQHVYLVDDESVQTYVLRVDWAPDWKGVWNADSWRQLGLQFTAAEPDLAWIDILSVTVVPKGAEYANASTGVRTEVRRGGEYRRTLWARAPARIAYTLTVPEDGRLDFAMGVLRPEPTVTFRVQARTLGVAEPSAEPLFEEAWSNAGEWGQRSIDVGGLAGQTVTLTLVADSASSGNVAFWAAPTLSRWRQGAESGSRPTETAGSSESGRPNIIFYVIDGGAADQMSVYGYNRRTTPNLERIGAAGAVFEYAYSNSSWSKTSTPSFMTSLQHSVLGGYASDNDALPDQAVTMAQHLHGAGYQTAVLTTNPYAGVMSSLDRGVDVLREAGVDLNVTSSTVLHEDFWNWRDAYPSKPYWVHFQTTDVHWPRRPLAPTAGLFVSAERRALHEEQERAIGDSFPGNASPQRFAELGIDRAAFIGTLRDLYDETLAYQDRQLGRLVERLEAAGQWENTLLIIAADHGTGTVFDAPKGSGRSIFSHAYRVPLIFVWPARIAAGQRFSEPVSMIDVLPTVLELAGLPPAETAQGRSLAPLLLGDEGFEPRPVILDEFYIDADTGALTGYLAFVEGRWLAWLDIPGPDGPDAPPRLRLFDRWRMPLRGDPVNDEFPEIAAEYARRMEEQWKAHRALAARFSRSGAAQLTSEQLRTLRALGYVR